MGESLDRRLRAMLDHHEITQLLAEYAHGCDRCDADRMGSTYWPDSWDDHGVNRAAGPAFSTMMTTELIPSLTETLSHLLGQTLITVDGDAAGAETYFIAVQRHRDADGNPRCSQLGGRYVDRLERRPDETGERVWKVKHRTCIRDWSVTIPVVDDSFLHAELTPGLRTGDDVSYAVLGWRHSSPVGATSMGPADITSAHPKGIHQ